jgi:peptide/nickel transport system substrate-binding protein
MGDIKDRYEFSRRGFLGAMGGTVGLMALAACSGPKGSDQAAGAGDVVYLSSSNFIGSWNPYDNQVLVHMRAQRMVYDYLMWIDDSGNFIPGLATSLELISPKVWEAKLRQGVTFHDGQPFTAKDVKASIELASNPKSVVGSLFPGQLTADVVDDFTVRINTPIPFAPLKAACLSANQTGAIISHLDAEKGESFLKQKMNGTGPFKMESYGGEAGGLHLTANDKYWRGKVQLKSITIQYVSDATTRLTALQTGQADIVEQLGPDQVKTLLSSPTATVIHTTSTDAMILDFRTQTAPMNNVALRKAICYAIDVPSIVKNIYGGYAVANTGYNAPNTTGFADDPNYFRYDVSKAKSLLAEAGYPGGQGLPTLRFLSVTGAYPLTSEYSQLIVQNLSEIGIHVTLQMLDEPSWDAALFKPEGDMILHGWLVPTPDRNPWYTSLFKSTGMINFAKDAKIDAAIEAQAAATDPTKRVDIIKNELEPALVNYAPGYPMFTTDLITGVSKKIKGLTIPHWYEFDVFPISKT